MEPRVRLLVPAPRLLPELHWPAHGRFCCPTAGPGDGGSAAPGERRAAPRRVGALVVSSREVAMRRSPDCMRSGMPGPVAAAALCVIAGLAAGDDVARACTLVAPPPSSNRAALSDSE